MNDFSEVKLNIRKKEIKCLQGKIELRKLNFYKENPRIYSQYSRDDFELLDNNQIQEKMMQLEHVRKLRDNIIENGGIIEPLIVGKKDMVVFDGNSRLAALRSLYAKQPDKWGYVNVILLPEDVDKKDISAILGVYHIVGRKDWSPFEQAGYLYRMQYDEGNTTNEISEILGIKVSDVKRNIEVYELMIKNDDAIATKWSYYDEFYKSSSIKKIIKEQPLARNLILNKIKNNSFPKAEELREFKKITDISGKKDRDKLIKKFIEDPDSFEDIIAEAEDRGGTNSVIKRMSKFNKFVADKNTIVNEYMKMNDKQKNKLKYILNKIINNLQSIKKDCK